MITKLFIENFRSIEKAEMDLGKITVLTGANNSGKSSVIYALLVLRNILTNSNQSLDNILTLPFINLGGFEQVVYLKNKENSIYLGFSQNYDAILNNKNQKTGEAKFQCTLHPVVGFMFLFPKKLYHNISFLTINNAQAIFKTDFVPIRRGFSKPFYRPVPLSSNRGITEDELATIISIDKDLIEKISHYLEKIVDRHFSIYTTPNASIFYLRTCHTATGFTTDLVNEGLGTNQLVTILAKVLQKDSSIVCIDELDIHLHPSVISKLVSVLVEIANKENKQFIVSTRSEHFIMALLKHIRRDDIKKEDVKVHYLKKEGQKTVIENKLINEKGQIEGGLVHFYETELDDLSSLFNGTD